MTTDQTVSLPIEGMNCEHCAETVTEALEGVDGVTGVNVDLDAGEATLTAADPVSRQRLAEAVETAGYEVPART